MHARVEGPTSRRLPVGAEVVEGGVHFRVWAPARRKLEVVTSAGSAAPLEREEGGYHSGLVEGLGAGARYWYRLDGELLRPDPASRFQPDGPGGASEVVDPATYRWMDDTWRGLAARGQVLYELHIGTFTGAGTWDAAARELAVLADLGVTAVEVLPVAEFPGQFGWGYDGVDLFAPTRLYGRPDDLRAFVDRAHGVGLGVVLDVVYNHLGPDANYLKDFAPQYFTDRYTTEWGEPLNFEGEPAVREFFLANARYWVEEYHVDGVRLDATQAMFDASEDHIVAAVTRAVREAAAGRGTFVVAENEPQEARLVRRPEEGGWGLDALWNDDFHHSAMVALTGRREAYYTDTLGTPQELVSCAKRGFLYQGQRYAWQGKRRGTPTDGVPGRSFVCYLQNHDQVANSAGGLRVHRLTSPGRHRAMTALLLLGPWTPMLFQGQEMDASARFLYFADHTSDLARAVRSGRTGFLRQFPSVATPAIRDQLNDPGDPETFRLCKIDPSERRTHREAVALHRDLLQIRRADPVVARQGEGGVDGAVLGAEAFCLRLFGAGGDDRLLLVNLGSDLYLRPAPEPLLAAPEDRAWTLAWSSEDPRYGGGGTPPVEDEDGFHITGHAAVLLAARKAS